MNEPVKNQKTWEERSLICGSTLNSVLFRNMPPVINEHIHNWHTQCIIDFLNHPNQINSLLDVGCGYGRLTSSILKHFPDMDINGLDISENYVKMYQKNTGKMAFQGTIEKLPLEMGAFDSILCVTVLMYVNTERLQQAFNELVSHLKPKGRLIMIENNCSGKPFHTGFGLKTLFEKKESKKRSLTHRHYFKEHEIEKMATQAGARITAKHRMPMTTMCILFLFILAKIFPPKMCRILFKPFSFFDALLKNIKLPTIYTAYLIEKE